jgi:hypothetical protein
MLKHQPQRNYLSRNKNTHNQKRKYIEKPKLVANASGEKFHQKDKTNTFDMKIDNEICTDRLQTKSTGEKNTSDVIDSCILHSQPSVVHSCSFESYEKIYGEKYRKIPNALVAILRDTAELKIPKTVKKSDIVAVMYFFNSSIDKSNKKVYGYSVEDIVDLTENSAKQNHSDETPIVKKPLVSEIVDAQKLGCLEDNQIRLRVKRSKSETSMSMRRNKKIPRDISYTLFFRKDEKCKCFKCEKYDGSYCGMINVTKLVIIGCKKVELLDSILENYKKTKICTFITDQYFSEEEKYTNDKLFINLRSENQIQTFLLKKCFMMKNVIIIKTFEIEAYYTRNKKDDGCGDHLLCTERKCVNSKSDCCAKKHNNHRSDNILFDIQGTMVITPIKYSMNSRCNKKKNRMYPRYKNEKPKKKIPLFVVDNNNSRNATKI